MTQEANIRSVGREIADRGFCVLRLISVLRPELRPALDHGGTGFRVRITSARLFSTCQLVANGSKELANDSLYPCSGTYLGPLGKRAYH